MWSVAGASSGTSVIVSTHLIAVHPYHPGTTSLAGAPWSRVSGLPPIFVARNAPARTRSAREKIQLAPFCECPPSDGAE